MKKNIRIGGGAGFSGDRIEPAELLAEKGNLDYLVLECLAERTIALAQKQKLANPKLGYDPFLAKRMTGLLPFITKNKITLITNMGAANPLEAAHLVKKISKDLGYNLKIAAVYGDDVYSKIINSNFNILENNNKLDQYNIISANAYLGVEGILEALKTDADIILTGRVADPSLFLAPMIYEFGWNTDDLKGKGTVIGHLLECGAQVSGGYFADGDKKIVPDLAQVGFPIAEINQDGTATISKLEGTGGLINLQTVKEQLLYEVTNPNEYFTPDVVADFTNVKLEEIAENKVFITGGGGKSKPDKLKVSVGYHAFYLGEGEISYAGKNAYERAKLAGEIIETRIGNCFNNLQIDYLGINAIFHQKVNLKKYPPYEVRLRVAGKAETQELAALIGHEVEALYTNGPAGGGGARKYVQQVIGIVSTLLDRREVSPQITML